VFFTSTVVDALASHTHDWNELTTPLSAWVTVHSVLMVVAGVIFDTAVIRAHVSPRWTGIVFIVAPIPANAMSRTRPINAESTTRPSDARRPEPAPTVVTASADHHPHHEHRSATSSRSGASR
jgi:hypothetical protein